MEICLHWVCRPDNESESCDGTEESSHLGALVLDLSTTIDCQMPDDYQVCDTSDCVPAPLLWGTLAAISSEQTCQDHDDIGNDGHQNMGTIQAGQETEIKQQKGCSQAPVHIASPEDLAINIGIGVWDVIMALTEGDVVDRNTVACSHSEVRDGSEDSDQGGDDMEEAFLLLLLAYV